MNQSNVYLETKVGFCPFLRFDRDNGLHVAGEFEVYGGETELSEPIEFEAVLDDLIAPAQDRGDYQLIYCVAHELRRFSERLTDTAQKMEDGNDAITDLYAMTPGDLDE